MKMRVVLKDEKLTSHGWQKTLNTALKQHFLNRRRQIERRQFWPRPIIKENRSKGFRNVTILIIGQLKRIVQNIVSNKGKELLGAGIHELAAAPIRKDVVHNVDMLQQLLVKVVLKPVHKRPRTSHVVPIQLIAKKTHALSPSVYSKMKYLVLAKANIFIESNTLAQKKIPATGSSPSKGARILLEDDCRVKRRIEHIARRKGLGNPRRGLLGRNA